MKVVTVVGARPQFIKAATLSRAFREHHSDVRELLVHTGQHYDANMSDVFFDELNIPRPDYNLGVGGGTHGQNTGRMIELVENVLFDEKPDWVLVYGDTDSTLAGALAAVKLHIPVVHVEAGLRSFNRKIPEEINRILTDHASSLLFTPTDTATINLKNEGVGEEKIRQVGDVMYDAALYYGQRAIQKSNILDTLELDSKSYTLATIHRAENTDDPVRLKSIIDGFALSIQTIVLPLHPRTEASLKANKLVLPPTVRAIKPVGYLDMVMLEMNAALIATDSGGVQKEAYFHGVPCLTIRDETEWVELVEVGANQLVAAKKTTVANALNSDPCFQSAEQNIYGRGDSANRICEILQNHSLINQ